MRSNNVIEVPAQSSKSPGADGATCAADSLPGTRYALENSAAQARDRFVALSALFDAGTIRHLEERGVSSGWHCLEVGGGGGSILGHSLRRSNTASSASLPKALRDNCGNVDG